ncbi:hypothetical protein Pelo_4754 [Pelomyxa schiedti]|nr:hypothetical protein Pelo_4754 [Pelomyxa schiedti]
MVFICLGFDAASVSWEPPRGDGTVEEPDFKHYTVYAMIYAMLNPTPDQSRSVLQSVINMMAFIFGLLVTIIGITLQFAADRTTKHVQALFFQDKFILSVLGFSLLGNAFVTWVYLELGDLHSPRIAVVLSVIISNVQFVLLFPFLSYLFVFLEPEKVANNLMESGLNAAIQSINASGLNDKQIIFNQVQTTLSIEYLMDAAISSIKKRQRNVSAEIVDALCSFCMHYLFYIKDNAPPNWFFIPTSMQQSPDFLILSSISIQELTDRKLWVEWKVLRQYQTLFNEALRLFTETCYHVSINTRIIGETAAIKAQTRVVDLVIKFFNTYLRAGINATSTNPNAVKVVYNCMFQYRHFAESLLDKSVVTEEIARRAIRIAKYQRYYAHFCHTKGLGFLVETVSHDLRLLCEFAFREIKALHPTDPPLAFLAATHEKLLGVFLSISDFNFDKMEQKRGILQSQIILATFYLAEGNYGAARRILVSADRQENKINLLSLKEELMGPTTKEFWEVSERATNFNYLEPARKDQLETLYEMFSFDPTTSDVTDYMHSPEGKKLKVLQEVTKFDDEIVETKADSDEEVPDEEEYELAAGNL